MEEPIVTPQEEVTSPAAEPQSQPSPTPSVPAPAHPAPAPSSGVEAIRAEQAAETERIAGIRRVCNGRMPRLEAQAIREGWTEQRTELEALRGQRPAVAAVHVADNTVTAAVLEAACCLSAGLSDLGRDADQPALELAERRFRGGIGLQELLLEAAWANGYPPHPERPRYYRWW